MVATTTVKIKELKGVVIGGDPQPPPPVILVDFAAFIPNFRLWSANACLASTRIAPEEKQARIESSDSSGYSSQVEMEMEKLGIVCAGAVEAGGPRPSASSAHDHEK